VWEEALLFRDVSAAAELLVEAWDVGGARNPEQLQRLATDPARVVANSRFLGRVEVPLSETIVSMRPGAWPWAPLSLLFFAPANFCMRAL
jgi:hypothetical protein